MIDLLTGVAGVLDKASLGVFDERGTKGNIFLGFLPNKPDNAIGIIPAPSMNDDIWNDTQRPNIQVLVRNNRVDLALDLSSKVYNELTSLECTHIGEETYVISCVALSTCPTELDRDDKDRCQCIYTFKLETMKEVPTDGSN